MLSYEGRQLCLERRSVKELADKLGTPLFLLSESRLQANYNALARGLSHVGTKATVRYCAKTNNESAVLAILAACGSHVLVSHPVEAQLALNCGFAPEKIAYQRPVLLEEEVRVLLNAGIAFFHAHRLQDLPVIERVASELGKSVKISLRLRNDSLGFHFSPLNFLSRRLGFRECEIVAAAERLRDSRWMTLMAINFYQGTQQESVTSYRKLLRRATRLAAKLQSHLGISLEEINLGGGIPSQSLRRIGLHTLAPRLRDDSAPSNFPGALEQFAHALSAQFRDEVRSAGLRPFPAIAVEPGRSIVGDAAILVTRARAVQGNWIFLDASRNYLGESPFLFTRRVLPVTRPEPGTRRYYHLSGSSLNTLDVIDFRRRLPVLADGDLLVLCDAGAYSISRAARYAGLSPALYLVLADGSLRMIRRAENLLDLTCPMVMPGDGESSLGV